jgi:hypothetical protein
MASKKEPVTKPEDPQGQGRVRLAEHPRARRQIALAKSWGGLSGFGAVLWFSLEAGVAAPDAVLRALACGVALYVLAWAVSIAVWGQIAVGEVHAQRRQVLEELERRREQQPDEHAAA